jgi:hypothetical protein
MIPRIGNENSGWIDGVLKSLVTESSIYAHRAIEPYLESDPLALQSADAKALLEACNKASMKIGWSKNNGTEPNFNPAIERLAEVVAVVMETDNAFTVFFREIMFEFARSRGNMDYKQIVPLCPECGKKVELLENSEDGFFHEK